MSVAAQALYGQCGGASWTGATACVTGAVCTTYNDYYAQCVAGVATATAVAATGSNSVVVSITPTASATASGSDDECSAEPEETVTVSASASATAITANLAAATTTASDTEECSAEPEETTSSTTPPVAIITSTDVEECSAEPEETSTTSTPALTTTKLVAATTSTATPVDTDSECSAEPETATTTSSSVQAATTTKSSVPTTLKTTTKVAQTTSTSSTVSASSSSVALAGTGSVTASATSSASSASASGQTKFAGVNIAGFDFGCGTDGTCVLTSVDGPITSTSNGTAQMQHFATDDNLNIFRLPVGWQFLVGGVLGGTLNSTNLAAYDTLVQGCLATGAYCIIDIHNYARWDGEIIGQGGPTNAQFADLWTQLATKYAAEEKIWFGTMNEPHDLDSVETWAETVQAVVTAIRGAGATSQYISLPGNGYTSASTFVSGGSAAALANVTNPDGTTTGLIFEVHKYLDSDNSGTSTECVTNNIDDAFSPLATWLRTEGRQALLGETGGGNTASCEQYLCEEIAYLNENSDVYLGYLGWSAGAFDSTYALTMTPTGSEDTALVKACLAR